MKKSYLGAVIHSNFHWKTLSFKVEKFLKNAFLLVNVNGELNQSKSNAIIFILALQEATNLIRWHMELIER